MANFHDMFIKVQKEIKQWDGVRNQLNAAELDRRGGRGRKGSLIVDSAFLVRLWMFASSSQSFHCVMRLWYGLDVSSKLVLVETIALIRLNHGRAWTLVGELVATETNDGSDGKNKTAESFNGLI